MGITAVSNANLAAGGNAGSALQPADGSGVDFSALLGQQLLNPQLLKLQVGADAAPQEENTQASEDGSAALLDPGAALAAAGLLPALMAGASPTHFNPSPSAGGDRMLAASGKIAADWSANAAGREKVATSADPSDLKADPLGTSEAGKTLLQAPLRNLNAGNAARTDTANIAVEPQSASGSASNFAATLAAQAAAQQAQSRHESAPAAPQISVPLQDSRWAQDFSDKVVWLAKNDQQTAQININPPQLGPMHITLNLSGDQASALFVSPHAEVRQAIEDAMPQLREMLAGAGINLGQANVGAQLPQQNSGTPQQFSDSPRFGSDNAILHGDSGHGTMTLPQPVRSGRGMVDLFA